MTVKGKGITGPGQSSKGSTKKYQVYPTCPICPSLRCDRLCLFGEKISPKGVVGIRVRFVGGNKEILEALPKMIT